MLESEIRKITEADFTISIRPGSPSLIVVDEKVIPQTFFEPRKPKLNRMDVLAELKGGVEIAGVQLSNPDAGVEREGAVMGFSSKQVRALQRGVPARNIRVRKLKGRQFPYIEGWHAIAEANRIFGFDGWDRETDSRCIAARETRGSILAIHAAKVRLTVRAEGATIVREGKR